MRRQRPLRGIIGQSKREKYDKKYMNYIQLTPEKSISAIKIEDIWLSNAQIQFLNLAIFLPNFRRKYLII